jgi:hypothetical protein
MHAQGGSVILEQRRPGAVFLLRWPSAPGDADATDRPATADA